MSWPERKGWEGRFPRSGCCRTYETEDSKWRIEDRDLLSSIINSDSREVKGGFIKAKRREIDNTTVERSDVIGIASIQQAIQDEQADIFDPVQKGLIRWEQLFEIGEILAGKKEGRSRPEQITLFKNNAGQGVADVALGGLVVKKALEKGLGMVLNV